MRKLFRAESNRTDGNLSLKYGEEKEVLLKREKFLSRNSVKSEDYVFIQTENEDKIVHVDKSDRGKSITAEALVTKDKGVILFLLTGDCFPVCFYDPVKNVVALAHLGWKPSDKKLLIKLIKEMESVYKSQAKDILLFIGPGIKKESYKFVEPVQKKLPEWSDFLTDLKNGETSIDLLGYLEAQALSSGVLKENIEINTEDTAVSDKYFSHYRSARTGEAEARFATIISLL